MPSLPSLTVQIARRAKQTKGMEWGRRGGRVWGGSWSGKVFTLCVWGPRFGSQHLHETWPWCHTKKAVCWKPSRKGTSRWRVGIEKENQGGWKRSQEGFGAPGPAQSIPHGAVWQQFDLKCLREPRRTELGISVSYALKRRGQMSFQ